jgi:hypothetical protein
MNWRNYEWVIFIFIYLLAALQYHYFKVSVSLAQLEIPSNLDKLAKGTPAFTIVSVCLCVCLATKDKLAKQNWEYLSNHWSDLLQIRNLCFWEQAKCYRSSIWRQPTTMEDDLPWKTTSKMKDMSISATTGLIFSKFGT